MKKNDYFVIVYRILTHLYDCFQAGKWADLNMISSKTLQINNGYLVNIIESMLHEGYIRSYIIDANFMPSLNVTPGVKINNLKITQKGIEYLQEDHMMEKAEKALKEVEVFIPGF